MGRVFQSMDRSSKASSDIMCRILFSKIAMRSSEEISNPFMIANDHKQMYVMYFFVLIQIIFSTNFFCAQIKVHN